MPSASRHIVHDKVLAAPVDMKGCPFLGELMVRVFVFVWMILSDTGLLYADCEYDLNGDGICDDYSVVSAGDDSADSIIKIHIGGSDKNVAGRFDLGDGGLSSGYIPGDFSLLLNFHTRDVDLTKYDFRWSPEHQDWLLYKKSAWIEPDRDEIYSLGGHKLPVEALFPSQFEVQRIACCTLFSQFSKDTPNLELMNEYQKAAAIKEDLNYVFLNLALGEQGPLFYARNEDGKLVRRSIPKDLLYEMSSVVSDQNARLLNDYAYYLYRSKNSVLAALLLRSILESYPERVVAVLNLADAYWDIDMKDKACSLYTRYVEKMTALRKSDRIPIRVSSRASCR